VTYDNCGSASTQFYAAQGANEAIDDLHGRISRGQVTRITFEYYEPGPGPATAWVRIFDNPGGSDSQAPFLGGPYVRTGLPAGRNTVELVLDDGPWIGPSLWVGVRFSSPSAGLVINSTPVVGESNDYYLENGSLYYFGGNPRANFAIRVTAALEPTGIGDGAPPGFALAPAFPNPSRDATVLSYSLSRDGPVRAEVFDLQGSPVAVLHDAAETAGTHELRWDGNDTRGSPAGAGVYLVRLSTAEGTRVGKIIRLP
jgi:hypothetical protein